MFVEQSHWRLALDGRDSDVYPEPSDMVAKHVLFEGRVQGVGFRYAVKELARGFEVRGWVRNPADGSVELLAVGEAEELGDFLREIVEESSVAGTIHSHRVGKVPVPDGLTGFRIVRSSSKACPEWHGMKRVFIVRHSIKALKSHGRAKRPGMERSDMDTSEREVPRRACASS